MSHDQALQNTILRQTGRSQRSARRTAGADWALGPRRVARDLPFGGLNGASRLRVIVAHITISQNLETLIKATLQRQIDDSLKANCKDK